MRKVLVTQLEAGKVSLTEIPLLVYQQFLKSFADGKEEIVEGDYGHTVRFVSLKVPLLNPVKKVFAILIDEPLGEAVSTTFALSSWIPYERSELLSPSLDLMFEINAYPSSRGWSYGDGRQFEEVIDFKTRRNNKSLAIEDPLTEYAYLALAEAYRLAKDPKFAMRKFIDHAPSSRC